MEPEQGGFFLGPEGLSFNRNFGQICLNVYFLFYSFVYFSSPCREDQLAVFFLIFFIRAFSPLPFSRKLLKKFLRGDFPHRSAPALQKMFRGSRKATDL